MATTRGLMLPWRWSSLLCAAAVVGLAACNDKGVTQPTAVVPTNAPATAAPATADNTTSSTSTSSVTTPSTVITTGATASTVITVATPTTLIRPADLVTDPNDPNNRHVSLPGQQPIIDAYLAAIHAELVTYARWPLNPRSPELVAAPLTAKWLEVENSGLVERTNLNQVLDISGGATLRPYVVENQDPNRAFVWDCTIDATFWKDKDSGEKAPPEAGWPNVGAPGAQVGAVAVLVLVDGKWLLDDGGPEPKACE
jgi:hypothetical protein